MENDGQTGLTNCRSVLLPREAVLLQLVVLHETFAGTDNWMVNWREFVQLKTNIVSPLSLQNSFSAAIFFRDSSLCALQTPVPEESSGEGARARQKCVSWQL